MKTLSHLVLMIAIAIVVVQLLTIRQLRQQLAAHGVDPDKIELLCRATVHYETNSMMTVCAPPLAWEALLEDAPFNVLPQEDPPT